MTPLFKVFMAPSVIEPLKEVLFSGYIGEGEKVKEFERLLQGYVNNPYVVATNCGTSALQLALRLSGVSNGDEVISTPMTCTATNMPILAMGAKIVWADIDPETGNIDPEDVAKKITSKTKAIICVNWGGYPCDFDELNAIAEGKNRYRTRIKLIEDACHAFGSTYHGKPIGSHSDFTCFSFQAIKHLTTVDGGMLTCRSEADYKRAKLLRWYGIDRNTKQKDLRCEADIKEYGYKFHMNDIAATIGIENLKYFDCNLHAALENAKKYDDAGFSLKYKRDRQSCHWLYTIKVKDRDDFIPYMKNHGIVVSKVHARNDHHTCFVGSRTPLPGVDEFCAEQVSIPVGWWVTETDEIIRRIEEWRRCVQ